MTPRKLLIMSAVAIVLIALAIWFSSQRHLERAHGLYEPLAPTLATSATAITAIDIFKAGDERAVDLKRADADHWTVSERGGYPADLNKISGLVSALREAKLFEQKTSNPENYASIGVEEVSAKTAKGVRVELQGLPTPVKIIVGKKGDAQSTFVRRANEAESWLIRGDIEAPADPQKWLATEIGSISADRIQQASVALDGSAPYTATKTTRADATYVVAPLPKARELASASAANGFATSLVNLTLDDVRAAKDFDGGKPAAHATYRTFDGLVIDVDGWTKDGGHWIALHASSDADAARRFFVPATPPAADKPAVKDAKDATPVARADAVIAAAKQESDQFDARTNGWIYSIADYKYDGIFKPLDQLLKKEEKPAATGAQSQKKK